MAQDELEARGRVTTASLAQLYLSHTLPCSFAWIVLYSNYVINIDKMPQLDLYVLIVTYSICNKLGWTPVSLPIFV